MSNLVNMSTFALRSPPGGSFPIDTSLNGPKSNHTDDKPYRASVELRNFKPAECKFLSAVALSSVTVDVLSDTEVGGGGADWWQHIADSRLLPSYMSLDNGVDLWSCEPVVRTALALFFVAFVASLYCLHIIALSYGKYRLYRRTVFDSTKPGVSVIKPIVGVDRNLKENIQSCFKLKYHQFELLFCFHERDDAAVAVVKELMGLHPDVSARIFYGGENVGLNPKINNMMPAYRAAKYPHVFICDSGIFMRPDALMDMVNAMDEDVAIVTQVPYCKDREGFGSRLEQVFFGTSHARVYLAGNAMRFVCSTGMSSLIRRKALDECGGLQAFGGYLAEDYFFGLEVMRRRWRCAICSQPALQNNADITVSKFNARIRRWMKLRIAMLPHMIPLEPISDCFASGILSALSLQYLWGFSAASYFVAHCTLWFLSDYLLIHIVQSGPLCFPLSEFFKAWLMREVFAPWTYLRALANPRIAWRRGTFILNWGGSIRQIKDC